MAIFGTKIRVGVAGCALATAAALISIPPAQATPVVPMPASPAVVPMPASPAIVPMPTSPALLGFGGAPTQTGWWLFDGSGGSHDLLASQVHSGWFPGKYLFRFFRALVRIIFGPYGHHHHI